MNGAGEREERPVIRLFGPLSIEANGRNLGPRDLGGARPKQVLEILLAARGHLVPTDRLGELLWAENRPRNAAGSLQTFVSVLRRRLATDAERARELVVTEHEAYRFATELIALDLDRFDELLERSAREPTRLARAALEQALDLVRGEVLEDEPYSAWALGLRGSYRGRVLGAHLDAADAALADLDFPVALSHTEAAAALDSYSERAHRSEMLTLYALGRSHEALARYRSFRMRLDEELGLEPSAETRTVEAAVIRQQSVYELLPRPIRREQADTTASTVRLLGRRSELDTLAQVVRRALEGNAALLQIQGETGFGKTRLLGELRGELNDVRMGRATCSELERQLPYVPLAAALREALEDVVEIDVERLPALADILPELASGSRRPHFDEVEVLEALVALVAEHAPLVLLLDDLQWADPRTLAALGYLRRRGASLAVAVVTTAPPTDSWRDHLLRALTPDVVLRLKPLSPDELAPLGIPDIHESTGGNPRFVIEALANGHPACPSQTLAEALLAQCRAEGDRAYRVLVAAAVLEQPFEPETLAALLGADATELTEELERLCERRILQVEGFRFRFRYDLVRQVLLAAISPARQRLLRQRRENVVTATSHVG